MKLRRPTLQITDLVVSAGFVALGLLVIIAIEVRELGSGWGDNGPQPGFFPFGLALVMSLAAIGAFAQALIRKDSRPFFEVRQEIVDLLKVGLPLALAIASVPWLGLYIMCALYITLFAWWYGRFRWYSSLAAGPAVAFALYLILFRGFHISMPKSIWYSSSFPL